MTRHPEIHPLIRGMGFQTQGAVMEKFQLVSVALVALAAGGSANAADLPVRKAPPPIWNWTGGYIGVHVGAAGSCERDRKT